MQTCLQGKINIQVYGIFFLNDRQVYICNCIVYAIYFSLFNNAYQTFQWANMQQGIRQHKI